MSILSILDYFCAVQFRVVDFNNSLSVQRAKKVKFTKITLQEFAIFMCRILLISV